MKKLLIVLMAVAVFVAFYEQTKPKPSVYVTVIAIAVFMIGMMRLSAKTPSKNQDENEGHV